MMAENETTARPVSSRRGILAKAGALGAALAVGRSMADGDPAVAGPNPPLLLDQPNVSTMVTGLGANFNGHTLEVWNDNTGAKTTALTAFIGTPFPQDDVRAAIFAKYDGTITTRAAAVWALSVGPGDGVRGEASDPFNAGVRGRHTSGGVGVAGTATGGNAGVTAANTGDGPALVASAGKGGAIRATSSSGVAVRAKNSSPDTAAAIVLNEGGGDAVWVDASGDNGRAVVASSRGARATLSAVNSGSGRSVEALSAGDTRPAL
jgi:hypothetical protein